MTLNTIVYISMQYIIIDQIKDSSNQLGNTTIARTPISCDLLSYNYTTTIWNVTNSACIVSSLQLLFWDLYEFRNEPLLSLLNPNFIVCIYSCLYHVHVFSPLLLICWRVFMMFGVFPCQGFSSSSLLLLKCTSSSHSCKSTTKVSWIANFTPL